MKWAIAFVVAAIGFWAITEFQPLDAGPPPSPIAKQKGVCWVAARQVVGDQEFQGLGKAHINWISQTPFGWQASATNPAIRMNTSNKRWWGESDAGISATHQLASERGIQSMLKPHLWVKDGWPGDISMKSAADWSTWFENYETFILHYAALAEKNKIEILCIGTELQQTTSHETAWRAIIEKIRKIYHGKLVYGANFHEEYQQIQFWDALDYVGVQGYFPLANVDKPTLGLLKRGWEKPIDDLQTISEKFKRPVIFTEIGYRSTEDAAIEPWKWPQQAANAKTSMDTQARCYQAFFETVWKKDWVAGAYFWKWYPRGPGRMTEIDFTPQGKLAETILTRYYND